MQRRDKGEAAGFRSEGATALVDRLRPLFPALGITRVANVTGMDVIGIPTVMVVRPNARSLSVSQGKGATLEAAKASGVMESLELWHAERVDRPLRLTSEEELARREPVIDVAGLPRFVRPYQRQERLLWIAGETLGGEPRWLPLEMVALDLRLPLPTGSGFFLAGSNGLASGSRRDEAIAHGLFEVIERDATTLFFALPAEQQWRRRVDLDSVDDPACRALLEQFRAAAVDVAVWETTSDVGLPSFLCAVLDREHDPFRPVGSARGAGCHTDRGVALARTLCEAAQSRLTRIVGTRDDIQAGEFADLQTAAHHAHNRRLLAAPARPPRDFTAVTSLGAGGVAGALALAQGRLAERGMPEVVVVDLSRPEIPVHVVRVVVPGLEALCEMPGYRPGRRAQAGQGSDRGARS